MLNKFWKPINEVKDDLRDHEIYLVNLNTFGLGKKGEPEYTSWVSRVELVDGEFYDLNTGNLLEDQYNTVTHVLIEPSMFELQTHIHEQNVEKGWWKSPRCFSTMTNLFISENSEALEGDRKNLMDDKLPKYPMRVVEIADMCIRVFDYLGNVENEIFHSVQNPYRIDDYQWNLALCTRMLTQSWFWKEIQDNEVMSIRCLRHAINIGFQMIREMGYNPVEIILEKHDFNAVRPDHKLENRTTGLPGAKAY